MTRIQRRATVLLALSGWFFWASPAPGRSFDLGGNPLNVLGFFSQTAQFGIHGDHYDVEEGLNSTLMSLFLEGDYSPGDDWSLYAAGMLSVDWIYPIKKVTGDDSWEDKRFDDSRNELFVDDEWWQLLNEAHITWMPGNFMLRIGKQRVSWGEMEVFAVNDVISPVDLTRGLSEIELETLFIPTPLVRAQYDFDATAGPFSDVGVQFIYNPNVDHIPDAGTPYGNDAAGIWAADVVFDGRRIGRVEPDVDEPNAFDPDFMEYGLRAYTTVADNTLLSLMAFYGRQNAAITSFYTASTSTRGDGDGNVIDDLREPGAYARQKCVGAAMATELPLRIGALGGFSPVWRLEGRYQFDQEFWRETGTDPATFLSVGEFFDSDVVTLGTNAEYKIRLPWQRGFLALFGEAQYNNILDHGQDWWNFYVSIATSYVRGKLTPMLEWYAQDNADFFMLSPSVNYVFNERWSAKLKANFFAGRRIDDSGLSHKDNVMLKIHYNFQ